MEDKWIVIPHWDRFQHPDVGRSNRSPVWIRTYVELLQKDEYLRLTGHQRAVLHGLWITYASSSCQVRADTASLTRRLALRVSSATLEALEQAGFIEVSACRPQAQKRREENINTKGLKGLTSIEDLQTHLLKDIP